MNKFLAALVLLVPQLVCGHARASTCDGIYPPSNEWVRNMTDGSEFIFIGTIVSVEDLGRGTQRIHFNIGKNIKGAFVGTALSGDWGPGFSLTPGETRVFFVAKDNYLQSCSDYKYYFTDHGIQTEIRGVVDGT